MHLRSAARPRTLNDPALRDIAEIVHDIDLKDDKFGRPEVAGIRTLIVRRRHDDEGRAERIARGTQVFDNLYRFLPEEAPIAGNSQLTAEPTRRSISCHRTNSCFDLARRPLRGAALPRRQPSSMLAAPQILRRRVSSIVSALSLRSRMTWRNGGRTCPAARQVVVYCVHGHQVSQNVAAAHVDTRAFDAGLSRGRHCRLDRAGLPDPPRHRPVAWQMGRPGERPKIDRIACPWLMRRFIDPRRNSSTFRRTRSSAVAEETGGTPYDIDGVEFAHEGDRCSFDTIMRSTASTIRRSTTWRRSSAARTRRATT